MTNAETVIITQGIGTVSAAGQQAVSPAVTTTYLLTASNSSGPISKSVTVGVDEAIIPPVLSEFMAENSATLEDQFGQNPDWIEIHNPNGFDLSLAGYHLTDKTDRATLWTFPKGTTVPAKGYFVVFASGENLTDPGEFLHTSFSLKSGGEYLALIDRDGQDILTEFNFPAGRRDVSYGLEADGATLGYFSPATPGEANGTSFSGFVADTKFDLSRGFYETPQTVSISSETPNALIRFTTDGSQPSETLGTVSYGADTSQKFPTTYFRKTIPSTDVREILGGTIRLKRDDGAVVYLNGIEIDRSSMPDDSIDYLTLANTASDDGRDFHTIEVPGNLFVEGDNVIAVEVHQSSDNSSDLQFDLELKISRPAEGSSPLKMAENMFVRSRSLDGNKWSALNEAFFNVSPSAPVAPGEVVPSEIHYNPVGPDNSEFLELHNRSTHAVNLGGCSFSDGVQFEFPDKRDIPLAPGARVLLVESQFGIDETYGRGLPVAGVYHGNLSNEGETVTLMAADGVTVLFSFAYEVAAPWPTEADGGGSTLVLGNPDDLGSPESWRSGPLSGGTPGRSDAVSFGGDPDADLDNDGFSAFSEFAMGTDDTVAGDALALTTFIINGQGHWEFTFPQSLTAAKLVGTVEHSHDLKNWSEASPISELTGSRFTGARVFKTYTSLTPATEAVQMLRIRFR